MSFLLVFWPKSLDAVAMATEVELNELTLDFLFLHDHYHCQQVSSKSESEREMVPISLAPYLQRIALNMSTKDFSLYITFPHNLIKGKLT